MTTTHVFDYLAVTDAAGMLARRHDGCRHTAVYGVPRGGCVPAVMVAGQLALPLADAPGPGVLVVDDLADSGRTASRFTEGCFDTLYRKSWTPREATTSTIAVPHDAWAVFPWEHHDDGVPTDAVVRLLEHIGEDPTRDGLLDTPARVVKAWGEMTAGYRDDPAKILERQFDVAHDQLIILTGIDFVSLCEHHILPFTGTAAVGYIANPEARKVVGLSKLARLVDCFAHRLQVQERLTDEIADALTAHLNPLGVGVVIRAQHSCMSCRGIRKSGSEMVTSAMHGYMRDRPEARAEFLALSAP